jgi:aminopeptidase N
MRRKHPKVVLAAAAALFTLAGAAPAVAAPTGTPGAGGGGDPYFPRQGNGGYRVSHYRLGISYTPGTRRLSGTARIYARTTQALSRFDLDLRRNLHVRSVKVDGRSAHFAQPRSKVQELVITPRHALRKHHRFVVDVVYAGTARHVTDPDGSPDGFITTKDGAFVASEPQGSPSWFPVNDIPTDKATYRVYINVPNGLTAVSNGAFLGPARAGARTTWKWQLTKPVSSYLVTATIGRFDVHRGRTPAGIPYFIAIDPTVSAKAEPVMSKLPAVVDYFSRKYGRYPFGQTGGIVDNAPSVGYALETATRPVFDSPPDVATLSHELAHQWFGDDVTLRHWRDIWLNEGFAEFSSWLWDEHTGVKTARQHLKELLAIPASNTSEWLPPPAHPGDAAGIFSGSVYDRGAGTLQALRQKVGSATFFTILRGWLRAHPYGNATVPQFRAYAEKVSHRDLGHFFYEWLDKNGKPSA